MKNLSIITHSDVNEENEAIFSKTILPYGLIINQECDLEHDFNNRDDATSATQDKYLPTIIILPAYLSEEFKTGRHRGADTKGEVWSSDNFRKIKQNNNSRFHFLEQDTMNGIPDLVIDFKHIFAVSRNVLYKQIKKIYLASIAELFREHISHRYTHYLSRIGLPEIN
ncbi:MAG: hypothetical protein ACKVOU_01090 [Cytophagales bacterium]